MPMTARAVQQNSQETLRETPDAVAPAPRSDEGSFRETLAAPGRQGTPVGQLQAALGAEFAAAPDEERWPLRWTVAMVFSTCGAFWTGVYFLVAAMIG